MIIVKIIYKYNKVELNISILLRKIKLFVFPEIFHENEHNK